MQLPLRVLVTVITTSSSLVSRQETIEQLLSNMLDGERSESVIVNGIQVLLTLLEPRRPRSVGCGVESHVGKNLAGLQQLAGLSSAGGLWN